MEHIFILEVLKVYPFFPLCSNLRSGSRNMIKRYGLSVSPCIVPLCMGIGCVFKMFSNECGSGL